MTSTFWSSLPIAENDSSPEGIISRKPPFQLSLARVKIDDNKIGKIIVDEEITKEDMYFILENGTSSSGNSFLLDPKLGKNNVIVKLKDEKETLLGFIFSIPCSLFLKKKDGDEIIDTGMTTHLSVSNQYRNKELAKYLIAGVIDYGFHHSIYTGYHFIENPKSASNILVMNYYRPLNIESAIEYGYQIPSMKDKDVFYSLEKYPSEKQLRKLIEEYSVAEYSEYEMRPSTFSDLSFLQSRERKISMVFSPTRFEELKHSLTFYTFWKGSRIVGLVIYKTMILHIGKIQKSCPIAQIGLLEMNEKYCVPILSNLFCHLNEKRYAIVSGVQFGELTSVSLRNRFGFITCGIQYLDFYNLKISMKQNPAKLNLLYL